MTDRKSLDSDEERPPLPIADLDAEAEVVSAVVLEGAIEAVRSVGLEAVHFYSDANRLLFQAATELSDLGKSLDVVAITSRLNQTGRLERAGGSPYVLQVVTRTPSVADPREPALSVLFAYKKRELGRLLKETLVELQAGIPDDEFPRFVKRKLREAFDAAQVASATQ